MHSSDSKEWDIKHAYSHHICSIWFYTENSFNLGNKIWPSLILKTRIRLCLFWVESRFTFEITTLNWATYQNSEVKQFSRQFSSTMKAFKVYGKTVHRLTVNKLCIYILCVFTLTWIVMKCSNSNAVTQSKPISNYGSNPQVWIYTKAIDSNRLSIRLRFTPIKPQLHLHFWCIIKYDWLRIYCKNIDMYFDSFRINAECITNVYRTVDSGFSIQWLVYKNRS